MKRIADAVRMELTSRGLKETVNNPDVIVDYSIRGQVFNEPRGGPVTSSEGTLVIDLTRRDSQALIWRSVYRDREKNSAKLAQQLPGDVRKSLSEYPPKQKGVIQPGPSTLAAAPKLSPKAAAAAALDIIESTREDAVLVGPNNHPGLSISMAKLERTARSVIEDDGRSQAATTSKNIALYEAISETAEYAISISDRGVETADTRTRARALAGKLRALSGS